MLIGVKEACAILKVSKPTMLKHAAEFGGFRIGKQWRFDSNKLYQEEKNEQREDCI